MYAPDFCHEAKPGLPRLRSKTSREAETKAVKPIVDRGQAGNMGRAAAVSWEQLLFDPIELPDGRKLITLRDAGHYIQELPKATQKRPEWQEAARTPLLVVECNGDTPLAYHAETERRQAAQAGIAAQVGQVLSRCFASKTEATPNFKQHARNGFGMLAEIQKLIQLD